MDEEHLESLHVGAELEIDELTACPKWAELHLTPKQTRKDLVTMETRRQEEEHWRQLFPEIKECVIAMVRPSPSQLTTMTENRRRSKRVRSCDPVPMWNWMEPLKMNHGDNKPRRFLKKVEFQAAPEDAPGKPQNSLRLTHCDSAHHQLHANNTNHEDFKDEQSPTDHNYCLQTQTPNSPECNSQSQDTRWTSTSRHKDQTSTRGHKDLSCFSAEEKKPPIIRLKKVRGCRWLRWSLNVRKEAKDDVEEEKDNQMKQRKWTALGPTINKLKRRLACGRCVPCLRQDCRTCNYCRDMKKFGGKSRLKQKCVMRRCENIRKDCRTDPESIRLPEETVTTATQPEPHPFSKETVTTATQPEPHPFSKETVTMATQPEPHPFSKETVTTATQPEPHPFSKETVTMATQPEPYRLRKSIVERDAAKTEEVNPRSRRRRWSKLRREKHLKLKHDRVQVMKKDQKLVDRTADQKGVKMKRSKRRRGRRRAHRRSKISRERTDPTVKGEEEELKRETPQCPLPVGPSGQLTGTHLQVTLDGSHLPPSILSDSTLTCLPGLLPQEGPGVILTFIPAPHFPAAIQSVQSKEEEEPVEINWRGGAGRWKEEEEPVEIDWRGGAGRWKKEEESVEIDRKGGADRWKEKEEEEPVEIDWRGGAGRLKVEEPVEIDWRGSQDRWKEKEEVCAEGVSERGKFYEVVVELPDLDSNEDTLTATLSATSGVPKAIEASDIPHKHPEFISLNSWSFRLFRGGASHSLAGGRGLRHLLQVLRRTWLPAHWVAVLADTPELQLLQCSKLSSMQDTIVHVQSDRSFFISIQNQQLPETHRVYEAHTHTVSHLSQLVSLLLHLEQLVVCRGWKIRYPTCQKQVRSASCHLLVVPPLYTCLPCLLEEESGEEEESEEDEESEEADA